MEGSWHEYGFTCSQRLRASTLPLPESHSPVSMFKETDARSLTGIRDSRLLEVVSEKESGIVWLEMISTRAAGVVEAEKILEICKQAHQSIAGEKLLKMSVFCSARYATDISIHLQWEFDPGPGSILGKELSSALADLGLTNHSLWIEQEGP